MVDQDHLILWRLSFCKNNYVAMKQRTYFPSIYYTCRFIISTRCFCRVSVKLHIFKDNKSKSWMRKYNNTFTCTNGQYSSNTLLRCSYFFSHETTLYSISDSLYLLHCSSFHWINLEHWREKTTGFCWKMWWDVKHTTWRKQQ